MCKTSSAYNILTDKICASYPLVFCFWETHALAESWTCNHKELEVEWNCVSLIECRENVTCHAAELTFQIFKCNRLCWHFGQMLPHNPFCLKHSFGCLMQYFTRETLFKLNLGFENLRKTRNHSNKGVWVGKDSASAFFFRLNWLWRGYKGVRSVEPVSGSSFSELFSHSRCSSFPFQTSISHNSFEKIPVEVYGKAMWGRFTHRYLSGVQ